MGRQISVVRPVRTASFPRPGEPIVPRLLRELVVSRHQTVAPVETESDLLASPHLGPEAWTRLPAERCRRLGMAVVDRVQTRLNGLPARILDAPLPDPSTALTFRIERRTANTLRRIVSDGWVEGPWTLRRYLGVRRFGGRAVVDLLAAAEANGGGATASEIVAERILDRTLTIIARQLPISEKRINEDIAGYGVPALLDLRTLARSTVRRGRIAPFQVMEIGGARVAVRLSQVTAARTAYRIASRAVQGWGAATIGAVSAQIGTVPGSESTDSFVEQVLVDLPAFRWIDRRNGWFWFAGHSNPLLEDLRKIFCVAPRISLVRLCRALFRGRPGPWPSLEALPRICAEVPGARVSGSELILDGPLDRSIHLSESENWLVTTLEAAGGKLPSTQLRARMGEIGRLRAPMAHLLRHSPLFATSGGGLVRLLQFGDDS
jgi:hypothetical protein